MVKSPPLPTTEAGLRQGAEDALLGHLAARAAVAVRKLGGPLTSDGIATLLACRDVVRHPARVVFDAAPLETYQFAQPEPDPERPGEFIIYVQPSLAARPGWLAPVVAYVIPVINYGPDAIGAREAEVFGSIVMGMPREDYYGLICAIADGLQLGVAFESQAEGAPPSSGNL